MRVTSITYGRVYNTGNYSSQRYEATADLESEDGLAQAIMDLKDDLEAAAERAMKIGKNRGQDAADDGSPF